MKWQLDKKKVVVRHLPPGISLETIIGQIEARFDGRFNWAVLRPGKNSHKRQLCSRAYIEFKRAEDVFEFAEFFHGHLFVNEKGTQFNATVEYAPSQRVPKQCTKKDGREGTIFQDAEYLEFLEQIAKPVQNLPSAEIQLERRETERAAAPKVPPIVTPLMEFVRQKRASKSTSWKILSNAKSNRRNGVGVIGSPIPSRSKGAEKKKISTSMYVLKQSTENTTGKEKPAIGLVPMQDNEKFACRIAPISSQSEAELLDGDNGVSPVSVAGKKKILLLKGKEKEILSADDGFPQQHRAISYDKNSGRLDQRREASGRMIRGVIQNKGSHPKQDPDFHSDQPDLNMNHEKEKRPPRSGQVMLLKKDPHLAHEEKAVGNGSHFKDRPDRVVWAPHNQTNGSYVSDEGMLLPNSQSTMNSSQAGAHKQGGRRGSSRMGRGSGGSFEGKPFRRGGHGSYEKQVWVQKSSSGS